jgi:hypothetical protein
MIFSDLPSPAEARFAKAGKFPPRIKSGAGFFGIMLKAKRRLLRAGVLRTR